MSQQDTGLYKSFAAVLGALVVFTLLIIVIANIFSPPTDHSSDPLIASNIKKQIEPIGRSNVRAEEAGKADESTAVAESTPVAEAPAAEAPAAEAPPVDASRDENTEATAEETGSAADEGATDTNAAVADSGVSSTTAAAPADADSDADSDAENPVSENETVNVEPASVDTAVEIPLNVRAVVATNCAGCHANGVLGAQRNDDVAVWQGLADKGIEALTASVINGVGEMPARAESSLDDAELQLAVQHMINNNLGGQQGAATSGTATSSATTTETAESGATAESSDAAVESGAEVESNAAAESSTGAAETVSSEAQATESVEIPDNVKAAVDSLCAACHISGVGNAPKYGDKDDWAARMANGIDAVAASAIAGKGAMPARGGSQLTDEEIKLAIQYMVSK